MTHASCLHCRKNAEKALSAATPEVRIAIEKKYAEHVAVCKRLRIAPSEFATFVRELMESPSLLLQDESSTREHFVRHSSPLSQVIGHVNSSESEW